MTAPVIVPALVAASLVVCLVGVVAGAWWWRARRRRAAWRDAAEERADRAALRMLRDVEGDEERETEVSFYLYFADRRAAESAAARVPTIEIDAPSLAVGVEPSTRGTRWLCLVTARIVPTERRVRRACAELRALATACGGEFDGWEAAMPW